MSKNRDKHATAEDIEVAIRQYHAQADVNIGLWACVLTVAHKQQGQQVSKRFQTALKERLAAVFSALGDNFFVVSYENNSFGARVSIWHQNAEHADKHGFPAYNNRFTIKIGDVGEWATKRQATIDVDYIKASNPWAGGEHERAALAMAALAQNKPREWADKIKAIDEAKKALLADAGAFRLQYLLDV